MEANTVILVLSGILALLASVALVADVSNVIVMLISIMIISPIIFVILFVIFWIYYKIWTWLTGSSKNEEEVEPVKEYKPSSQNKYSYTSGSVSYSLLYNSNLPANAEDRFVSLHIETTGLDYTDDRIVEIAAVLFENGKPIQDYCTLINSDVSLSDKVSQINGITNDMLQSAPSEEQVMWELVQFMGDALEGGMICTAYKATFVMRFLQNALKRHDYTGKLQCADVFSFSKDGLPDLSNHRMKSVAEHLHLEVSEDNRALADATLCGKIFLHLLDKRAEKGVSWDVFYRGYKNKHLADVKTQCHHLLGFGPRNQVLEVLEYFDSEDEELAEEMLRALIDEKYCFTADQILEMDGYPEELVAKLATYAKPFRAEQLSDLKWMLGEDIFESIKYKLKMEIPDSKPVEIDLDSSSDFVVDEKESGIGDFMAGAVLGMLINEPAKKHSHKCDGDCTNCPPHYGYYYNRYFLGKGHTSGCERGGNGRRDQ